MAELQIGTASWERMIRAVEKVRERLIRASTALEKSGVDYAVVGGHAVAAWVSSVDEAAVRNTRDVDILVRREEMHRVTAALAEAGFVRRKVKGIEMFLEGAQGRARDVVHILFANEKVRADDAAPAPNVTECVQGPEFRYVNLAALVQMKLTSFRDKDRMHLRDLYDVSLIDASWLPRLPPELATRLQVILDTPDG
jgi:hypothetical protein